MRSPPPKTDWFVFIYGAVTMAHSHGSVHLFVVNCNEEIYTSCLQYSSFPDNGMASLIDILPQRRHGSVITRCQCHACWCSGDRTSAATIVLAQFFCTVPTLDQQAADLQTSLVSICRQGTCNHQDGFHSMTPAQSVSWLHLLILGTANALVGSITAALLFVGNCGHPVTRQYKHSK